MLNQIKGNYNHTLYASFAGYVTQAIVNNFAPLLFLTFQRIYGLSLERIALLITINFGIQLLVDLLSVKFMDKIGYRTAIVGAHLFAAAGLILMTVLPEVLPLPYIGLLISVALYAVGGGIIEVLISPIVEACPTKRKEAAMSLLHSFYCWGHVGVVILSTLFFGAVGVSSWKLMSVLWAVIPLCNAVYFLFVPIRHLNDGEAGIGTRQLLRSGVFWIMFILVICSGASEQSVSQWASVFAEEGLGISKTIGDLAGPGLFAMFMGTSRALYAKFSDRIGLKKFMMASGVLCLISYLVISLSPYPVLGLIGCSLCGLSVGILWPGTFSLAAKEIPRGGTAMFALFALGGDLGCMGGPAFVGVVSGLFQNNIRAGILCAAIFPILLLIFLSANRKRDENRYVPRKVF